MYKKTIFSFFACIISLTCTPCLAAPQYRCQGKVQYRPCGQAFSNQLVSRNKNQVFKSLEQAQRNSVRAALSSQALANVPDYRGSKYNTMLKGNLYAEIISPTFQVLKRKNTKNKDGQWRGMIEGNGNIFLTLQILRNGITESTRSMGNVKLNNDRTSFNFISTIPKGPNWSWRILADARS